MKKKPTQKQLHFQRYVLIGGGLGLYFGLFFRPISGPDYSTPFYMGLLAALITILIRYRQEFPPLARLLKEIGEVFVVYVGFLEILALRHLALELGGKGAVAFMTTAAGMALGYFYARSRPFETKGK
jgi:hypothetical protein